MSKAFAAATSRLQQHIEAPIHLRMLWDGRQDNCHLRKRPFRIETLHMKGLATFERSTFGGTLNISSAYHHVDMAPKAFPYLGYKWAPRNDTAHGPPVGRRPFGCPPEGSRRLTRLHVARRGPGHPGPHPHIGWRHSLHCVSGHPIQDIPCSIARRRATPAALA